MVAPPYFGTQTKKGDDEEEDLGVSVVLQQSVTSTFSLKYLLNFTKSAPLAKRVSLSMSDEIPMLVSGRYSCCGKKRTGEGWATERVPPLILFVSLPFTRSDSTLRPDTSTTTSRTSRLSSSHPCLSYPLLHPTDLFSTPTRVLSSQTQDRRGIDPSYPRVFPLCLFRLLLGFPSSTPSYALLSRLDCFDV